MRLMKNSSLDDQQRCQKELEDWFQTPLGRQLLADQRKVVEGAVGNTFGNFQLDFVVSHRLPISSNSSVANHVTVIPKFENDLPSRVLVALPHEMPIQENSVDLVTLHHTLDVGSNPHQILRDVSRSLRSGGHLLIVGFNPVSYWGVCRLLLRERGSPWNNRFISSQRVEDWLGLLDFRVEKSYYSFYRVPVQRWSKNKKASSLERLCIKFGLPLGAYYCVVAQKQVGAAISVKPKWKSAKVIGMPVANGLSKGALLTGIEENESSV